MFLSFSNSSSTTLPKITPMYLSLISAFSSILSHLKHCPHSSVFLRSREKKFASNVKKYILLFFQSFLDLSSKYLIFLFNSFSSIFFLFSFLLFVFCFSFCFSLYSIVLLLYLSRQTHKPL